LTDGGTRNGEQIFVTHCSGEKDDSLRGTGRAVGPDALYTSARFGKFARACRDAKVEWAVLSDRYGIWFADETREWYEKMPEDVTEAEFRALVKDFDAKLARFGRIRFYHEPGRLHELYRRIIEASTLSDRIEMFTDLKVIR
jgi:hypothetical protein